MKKYFKAIFPKILITIAAIWLLNTPATYAAVDCCCDMQRTSCTDRVGNCVAPTVNVISQDKDNCAQLQSTYTVQTQEENTGWLTKAFGFELIPAGCRQGKQTSSSECGINEIIQVLINITRIILGIMGSLALLMFVYGGLMFIISGGSSDKIATAKKILTNAVVGIIIILTAWMLVNFIIIAFSGQAKENLNSIGQIFNTQWTKGPPQ